MVSQDMPHQEGEIQQKSEDVKSILGIKFLNDKV